MRQVRRRRPLPDLQRRPLRRGQRRDDRRRRCASTPTRSQCVERLVAARAARRRPGQHHRDRRRRHRRRTSSRQAPIVGGAAARDRGMTTLGRRLDAGGPRLGAAPRRARRRARAGRRRGRRRRRSRPAPAPGAHRRCCWCCWSACSAAASGCGWQLHPVAVLRRRDRRRHSSPSSRACPGEIAGLDLSSVHETSEHQPRRPDPGRPGAGASRASRPTDEPDAQRRLAELTSDDPANPNLQADLPAEPDADRRRRRPTPSARRRRTARRRRRAAPADPDAAGAAPTTAGRPADRLGAAGHRPGRLPAGRLSAAPTSPRDILVTAPAVRLPRPHHGRAAARPGGPRPGATSSWRCSSSRWSLVAGLRGHGRGQPARTTITPDFWVPAAVLVVDLPRRCTWRSGSWRRTPTRCCCRRWRCSTASGWRSCAGSTSAAAPPAERADLPVFAGIGGRQLAWTLAAVVWRGRCCCDHPRPPGRSPGTRTRSAWSASCW